MAGKLPRDTGNIPMQLWTIHRVQAVTSGVAWTPGADDRGFSASVDVTVIINNGTAQTGVLVSAERPVGVVQGYTYTFNATTTLEIM